jgi:hypothetical protein
MKIPRRRITWRPSRRIVPSRYPTVHLFERVAPATEFEALAELESMTNDRLRDERGEIALVPREERPRGVNPSVIMAPFTHLNPEGSRFSDGTYGVCYVAHDLETAIEETRHHRARFMRATREPPMELEMRVYLVDLDAELHDLRGRRRAMRAVHSAENYAAAQRLARRLRSAGSAGIAYPSVRRPGGECAAVFTPSALSNCRQERHLSYVWDGEQVSRIYRKTEVRLRRKEVRLANRARRR